jgi:IS5 family transposase
MNIHIGADVDSGLTHAVSVTPAHAPGISQLPDLLREGDRTEFGDKKGYVNYRIKRAAHRPGACWAVALKASTRRPLTAANKRTHRRRSRMRNQAEHLLRALKCPLGYVRVRYKGSVKSAVQVCTLINPANLHLMRKRMLA